MEKIKYKRSSFTGKLGFVLAAAGSAVGLGNLWRFPYITAKCGGGIFLLVYIILVVTLGYVLMSTEIGLGRLTRQSAIGAFGKLSPKWTFLGYLESIVPIIILPYYSVIGGWVIKYLASFVSGAAVNTASDTFFNGFVSKTVEPVIWFVLFLTVTTIVIACGVQKGIESTSKIMMPALVVLALIIAVYSMTRPGAAAGIKYFLIPNTANFTKDTILSAMGQMFYSLSLAMGIMITYGSYMKKTIGISQSVFQIELFDTLIAIIAGLMIIPAVFAFNGADAAEKLNAGPGLMFVTLPQVFTSMKGGVVIGSLFFILVLFAALTSSISLMEAVVSIFCDKFNMKRIYSILLTFALSLLLGVPSSLGNGIWGNVKIIGMDFLSFFDFISNNVIMPVVALLICIFVGYIIKPKAIIDAAEENGFKFFGKTMYTVLIKYVAPICILVILAYSVLTGLGIVKGV